jgi:hypothetical protein
MNPDHPTQARSSIHLLMIGKPDNRRYAVVELVNAAAFPLLPKLGSILTEEQLENLEAAQGIDEHGAPPSQVIPLRFDIRVILQPKLTAQPASRLAVPGVGPPPGSVLQSGR